MQTRYAEEVGLSPRVWVVRDCAGLCRVHNVLFLLSGLSFLRLESRVPVFVVQGCACFPETQGGCFREFWECTERTHRWVMPVSLGGFVVPGHFDRLTRSQVSSTFSPRGVMARGSGLFS